MGVLLRYLVNIKTVKVLFTHHIANRNYLFDICVCFNFFQFSCLLVNDPDVSNMDIFSSLTSKAHTEIFGWFELRSLSFSNQRFVFEVSAIQNAVLFDGRPHYANDIFVETWLNFRNDIKMQNYLVHILMLWFSCLSYFKLSWIFHCYKF